MAISYHCSGQYLLEGWKTTTSWYVAASFDMQFWSVAWAAAGVANALCAPPPGGPPGPGPGPWPRSGQVLARTLWLSGAPVRLTNWEDRIHAFGMFGFPGKSMKGPPLLLPKPWTLPMLSGNEA